MIATPENDKDFKLPPAEDIYDMELEELERYQNQIQQHLQSKIFNSCYETFEKFERKAAKIKSLVDLEITERQQVDGLITFFLNGPSPDILSDPVASAQPVEISEAEFSAKKEQVQNDENKDEIMSNNEERTATNFSEIGASDTNSVVNPFNPKLTSSVVSTKTNIGKPPSYSGKAMRANKGKAAKKALQDFMREKLASTKQEVTGGMVVGRSTIPLPPPAPVTHNAQPKAKRSNSKGSHSTEKGSTNKPNREKSQESERVIPAKNKNKKEKKTEKKNCDNETKSKKKPKLDTGLSKQNSITPQKSKAQEIKKDNEKTQLPENKNENATTCADEVKEDASKEANINIIDKKLDIKQVTQTTEIKVNENTIDKPIEGQLQFTSADKKLDTNIKNNNSIEMRDGKAQGNESKSNIIQSPTQSTKIAEANVQPDKEKTVNIEKEKEKDKSTPTAIDVKGKDKEEQKIAKTENENEKKQTTSTKDISIIPQVNTAKIQENINNANNSSQQKITEIQRIEAVQSKINSATESTTIAQNKATIIEDKKTEKEQQKIEKVKQDEPANKETKPTIESDKEKKKQEENEGITLTASITPVKDKIREEEENKSEEGSEEEEEIPVQENEKITEIEDKLNRLKKDTKELNQSFVKVNSATKKSDNEPAIAEKKPIINKKEESNKEETKKIASKDSKSTQNLNKKPLASDPKQDAKSKQGCKNTKIEETKSATKSNDSASTEEEQAKPPTKKAIPKQKPKKQGSSAIPAHIEEIIVDYSKYYKSFMDLFNGYIIDPKKFDLNSAAQDTFNVYKMYNSLLDDKTMFQFAFDAAPLEKSALDYFAYGANNEMLVTKEISDRMLDNKNQNVDNIKRAMLQAKLQEKFKKLKEKQFIKEDDETAASKQIEKEVTQLIDVDRKSTLLYRVVQNREEVYDIVTKAFSRKTRWNEMPHGVSLKHSWNLLWTWSKPNIEFTRLLVWQKVNHFPGAKNIARKDYLKRHIERCQNLSHKASLEFDIIPLTFLLPNEYLELVDTFNKAEAAGEKFNYWIMKPCAKSRGRGISLFNSISSVAYGEPMIVQEYLKNPLLLGGYKFDMRIYVLVTSFNPLEAFIYKEGFARLSTVKFSLSAESLMNKFIHLTNSSIQEHSRAKKDTPDSQFSGTKISLEQLKNKLYSQGVEFSGIWTQIVEIVTKSLIACQLDIPYNPSCFELFGYDIMVDSHLKCWLVEVNSSPSLGILNLLDDIVKIRLMDDLIDLIDVMDFDRKRLEEVLKRRLNEIHRVSSLSGSQATKMLNKDLTYILNGQEPREYGEMPKFLGGFDRLAPTPYSDRIVKLVGGQKMFGKHVKAP